MIISITYGDQKYERAKKFNCRMALKYGADKAIAFGPEDISEEYKEKNREIWQQSRGGGYWIWKPYIINKVLNEMQEEDYLVYTDAGAIFVNPIACLLREMEREKTDLMAFCVTYPECWYTKMDAFLLMECNEEKYMRSFQNLSGYILMKRTEVTKRFVQDFLDYIQDERIVTDLPNQLGVPNCPEFRENRHDQSCFSLLCKKYGIPSFRDPSQFGMAEEKFPEEVRMRSNYPQVINSFRDPQIGNLFQLKYINKKWYKYTTWMYYKSKAKAIAGRKLSTGKKGR